MMQLTRLIKSVRERTLLWARDGVEGFTGPTGLGFKTSNI